MIYDQAWNVVGLLSFVLSISAMLLTPMTDFDVLPAILSSLKISPGVIDWFRSYLLGRRQRIHLDKSYSHWSNTTVGVPQSGVLSPLLFPIFINSISDKLTSSYHLYADDLQIYSQDTLPNLSKAITKINADLSQIQQWTTKYGIVVNPVKTQLVVVGSSRLLAKVDVSMLPRVILNGITVPFSEKVKNLGIYIDNTLSWSPQLQIISRKLYGSAASLRRLRNFLPIATKTALAQSILLPILDYANVSYLDLNENQLDKLERLQNFCIRFIFGLRKMIMSPNSAISSSGYPSDFAGILIFFVFCTTFFLILQHPFISKNVSRFSMTRMTEA